MRISRAVVVVALIAAIAAAWFAIREQRAANRRLTDSLTETKIALDQQTRRGAELEQQVATLNERVVSLEQEVVRLRRERSTRPTEIARADPAPIDAVALAPMVPAAEPLAASGIGESLAIETIPVTWNTDWSSYQPAGIIAPAPPIVLERKLTDPAFVKKMYIAYGALQAADIVSTTVALNRGGREGNPLLRDVANSPAAMIGVKAAVTVTTIIALEKLRGKHPVAASVSLIVLNTTLAAVAINNVYVATASNAQPGRR